MVKLIIIRHGETDANKDGICQSINVDTPLNINGLFQANKLKNDLLNENIDIILSSPLARARQTAEIVSIDKKTEVICFAELKEVNTGDIDGMSYNDFYNKYSTIFGNIEDTLHKDFLTSSVPNGESRQDVFMRWQSVLNYIKTKLIHCRTIGISTHYGVIKALLFYYKGEDRDEIDNCEFFCMDI